MCTRQPPSLADSARHVVFNYTLHLDRFHIATDTTYDQYVYTVRSNRVLQVNLLPPEAPLFSVGFCCDIDSPIKFHSDCLGAGPWRTMSERKYDSDGFADDMIKDLITNKNYFRCHHCNKGLFFLNSCFEHASTVEAYEEEEKGAGVAGEEEDDWVEGEHWVM